MRKLLTKKAYFAAIYAVMAIVMELITFAVLTKDVIPEYWGLDIAFIIGLALIVFLIPSPIAAIVFAAVFLVLQAALAVVNEALMSMSGIVFSLTMLNLAKEVGGVFNSDFVNWWLLLGMLALFGVALAGMIVIHKFMPTPKTKFSKQAIVVLLLCCLIGENAALVVYQFTVGKFKTTLTDDVLAYYSDDEYLYNTQFIPAKALRKFGTFGFYFMNVSNTVDTLVSGFNDGVASSEQYMLGTLDKYFAEGEMSEDVYGENPYTGALAGKNIVLIVIESGEWFGINQEYTPTLYSMAKNGIAFTEYYARDKTNHSEAMSILGSYPVQNDPAKDLKGHTLSFTLPNLLRSAGYTTNYFHANAGEFYERNQTFGKNGIYGFDTAHFPENMPALKGYKDPNKEFYDFDKDATVLKNYYDEYTHVAEEDRAFFTMQMTLSSHGHYDDLVDHGDYPGGNTDKYVVKGFEKYYALIDDYPTTYVSPDHEISKEYLSQFSSDKQETIYRRYKRFQAGMMDLDEAINSLAYNLNKNGELDDTVFFFYADHTAYYNNQNYFLKGIPEGESWNTKQFHIPCFMWYGGSMNGSFKPVGEFHDDYSPFTFTATKDTDNPLQSGTVGKFTNSFDIVPTLLQLVGYDYNLNLYQGVSMFSNRESVFVSRESGIFVKDKYFDGTTVSVKNADGSWTQIDYESTLLGDGFEDDVAEFIRGSVEYYEKQKMLELVYSTDYFSKRKIERSNAGTWYVRQVKTNGRV